MRPKTKDNTRDKDEYLLRILRLRMVTPPTRLAPRLGLTPPRVRTLCNRVLDDDIKFSGEPEHVVRAGYWGM